MDLRLPTKEDVLGFFEHLNKSKVTKDDAIHGLSAEIVKTWTKADCPPMTIKSVKTKFRLLFAEPNLRILATRLKKPKQVLLHESH